MSEPQGVSGRAPGLSGWRKDLYRLVLVGVIPLLSGAAYLAGVAYHQEYLNAFHVPHQLITRSTADYFLNAYLTITWLLERLFTREGGPLLLMIFLVAFLWLGMGRLGQWISSRQWVKRLRERLRPGPRVQTVGVIFLIPGVLVVATVYALFTLLFVLVIPQAAGSAAGRHRAAEDLTAFQRGCVEGSRGHRFCNSIYDDGNLVATGFIIDSSDKYVAVYDGTRARTIPVGAKHFFAVHQPGHQVH